MKSISVQEVEYLAHRLAREIMSFDEPIPDFSTRYPGVLERCLRAPYHTFGGKQLYRGLSGKASILFYVMIKDHPFQNGNKRIAMTTLLTSLSLNGKWLSMDTQSLYNFTMWVASSPPEANKQVTRAIEEMIRKNAIDFTRADQ